MPEVLLSLVAVLAAYSGYAAAKWSTESFARQGLGPAHEGERRVRRSTKARADEGTRTLDLLHGKQTL
jgi:hypothetical protein